MKKLFFVLITIIACSCAKDPRDEICGKYSCTRSVEVIEQAKTVYGNRVIKNLQESNEETCIITITKSAIDNKLLHIEDDKKLKSVSMYASISEDGKMLYPIDAYVHTEYTDIFWSNIYVVGDILIFTEKWKSSSQYYEDMYGERICETTTITAEYVATKIKEQD